MIEVENSNNDTKRILIAMIEVENSNNDKK